MNRFITPLKRVPQHGSFVTKGEQQNGILSEMVDDLFHQRMPMEKRNNLHSAMTAPFPVLTPGTCTKWNQLTLTESSTKLTFNTSTMQSLCFLSSYRDQFIQIEHELQTLSFSYSIPIHKRLNLCRKCLELFHSQCFLPDKLLLPVLVHAVIPCLTAEQAEMWLVERKILPRWLEYDCECDSPAVALVALAEHVKPTMAMQMSLLFYHLPQLSCNIIEQTITSCLSHSPRLSILIPFILALAQRQACLNETSMEIWIEKLLPFMKRQKISWWRLKRPLLYLFLQQCARQRHGDILQSLIYLILNEKERDLSLLRWVAKILAKQEKVDDMSTFCYQISESELMPVLLAFDQQRPDLLDQGPIDRLLDKRLSFKERRSFHEKRHFYKLIEKEKNLNEEKAKWLIELFMYENIYFSFSLDTYLTRQDHDLTSLSLPDWCVYLTSEQLFMYLMNYPSEQKYAFHRNGLFSWEQQQALILSQKYPMKIQL